MQFFKKTIKKHHFKAILGTNSPKNTPVFLICEKCCTATKKIGKIAKFHQKRHDVVQNALVAPVPPQQKKAVRPQQASDIVLDIDKKSFRPDKPNFFQFSPENNAEIPYILISLYYLLRKIKKIYIETLRAVRAVGRLTEIITNNFLALRAVLGQIRAKNNNINKYSMLIKRNVSTGNFNRKGGAK